MTENEFILQDRLGVIRDTINKYGEENFYLSFSGGKDSTVVHHLLDMALPNNRIPRVFDDTGIEYNLVREFVQSLNDDRIVTVRPKKNIHETLEKVGYPFKSKEHSQRVHEYQATRKIRPYLQRYIDGVDKNGDKKAFQCPEMLKYQFTEEFTLKVSNLCCKELKKKPLDKWMKENGKTVTITGMMRGEGGARNTIDCIHFKGGKLNKFHPLAKVTKEWEDWFIQEYNIKLCKLYYEPYNFHREGCKGCPFSLSLSEQLETMERYFPAERKQCEIIWKPVYDEYRRLGYRLKKEEQIKLL